MPSLGLSSLGEQIFISTLVCSIVAGVAVALRLGCKTRSRFDLDDVWTVLALGGHWTGSAVVLWGVFGSGGGLSFEQLEADRSAGAAVRLENFLLSSFIAHIAYQLTVYAIKMAALSFYLRVFSHKSVYRKISLGVMAFASVFFIASIVTDFVLCKPIKAFWHATSLAKGRCLDTNLFYFISGTIESFLELVVLALPLRMVVKLRVSAKARSVLGLIFLIGFASIASSCMRATLVYLSRGRYEQYQDRETWTQLHIVLAIITSCMPICGPIWVYFSELIHGGFPPSKQHQIISVDEKRGVRSRAGARLSVPLYIQMETTLYQNSSYNGSVGSEGFMRVWVT